MGQPSVKVINTTDVSTLTTVERNLIGDFMQRAEDEGYEPTSCLKNPHCGLFLVGRGVEEWGTDDLPCLAVYQDELGNWVALVRNRVQEMGKVFFGAPTIHQFILGEEVL